MSSDVSPEFYEHSGSLGNSFTTVLVFGTPVAVVMAAIYSYLLVYVPIVGYVNVLFLGGYVAGTGLALAKLAKIGKSRNAKSLFLLGCLVGAIGLYAAWVFFFKALGGDQLSLTELAMNPQFVWDITKELNKEGWWDGCPTGTAAWIVWGIEALAFIVGCGMLTTSGIDREVYCEQCQSWCEPTAEQNLKITEKFAESLEVEEADDWKHFDILKLPAAETDEYPRFVGEVLQCPDCSETTAIRLTLLTQKEGDNGLEEVSKPIDGIILMPSASEA